MNAAYVAFHRDDVIGKSIPLKVETQVLKLMKLSVHVLA